MLALLIAASVLSAEGRGTYFPAIGSEESNICGPLCLAAAAGFHGKTDMFERIFSILPPDGKPRTISELQRAAQQLGFSTKAVRWKYGYPPITRGIAIARLAPATPDDPGHFILILSSKSNYALTLDPPNEPEWTSVNELWTRWDGTALYIALDEDGLPGEAAWFGPVRVAYLAAIGLGSFAILASAFIAMRHGYKLVSTFPRRLGVLGLVGASMTVGIASVAAFNSIYNPYRTIGELEVIPAFRVLKFRRSEMVHAIARVSTNYRIYNHGRSPAKIERITSSCGCAAPELHVDTIPPGAYAEVKINVNPSMSRVSLIQVSVGFSEPQRTIVLGAELRIVD